MSGVPGTIIDLQQWLWVLDLAWKGSKLIQTEPELVFWEVREEHVSLGEVTSSRFRWETDFVAMFWYAMRDFSVVLYRFRASGSYRCPQVRDVRVLCCCCCSQMLHTRTYCTPVVWPLPLFPSLITPGKFLWSGVCCLHLPPRARWGKKKKKTFQVCSNKSNQ